MVFLFFIPLHQVLNQTKQQNMSDVKKYKIGDTVNFSFLGEKLIGIVIEVIDKENCLLVRTKDGTFHRAKYTQKESDICHLI